MQWQGSKTWMVATVKSVCAFAFRLAVLAAVFWGGYSQSALAGEMQWASEYELKAAFVYNILSFVDWPRGILGNEVVIGFAGEGPMEQVMVRFFADKHIESRAIEVRAVHNPSQLRGCNVLVVAYPDRSRTTETLALVQNQAVLTIGDGERFANSGGTVALVPHDSTFGVAINPKAAERARLKISSKLLHISTLVSDDETGGREDK